MAEPLTVGSLFSGIGGLDLGLERAGMRVIWQSEIDPYACRVLKKHWPEVPNYGDIKEINWDVVEPPDVICGGYPCQPFSTAGKRRGEEDPRHLWPWVRDTISRLRPRYAILENVRGHLSLGGLSVIGELATIGYDAEWRVVSAASVGAAHRRDRVIIVAYPNSERLKKRNISGISTGQGFADWSRNARNVAYPTSKHGNVGNDYSKDGKRPETISEFGNCGGSQIVANDERIGDGEHRVATNAGQTHPKWVFDRARETGYDGWQWWQVEPDVGRVADGVPARVDRLRGLGNAVVPQVAEVIGRLVIEHANA